MAKSLSSTIGGNIVFKSESGVGKTKVVGADSQVFQDACKSGKKKKKKKKM